MQANLSTLSFGTKKFGLLSLTTPHTAESVDDARALAGPMNIEINFDVSGSMISNMETLRKTLGALIDMGLGSTLSVGVFDHEFSRLLTPTLITKENQEMLKSSIVLRNRQGYTNLQDTLGAMLQTPGIKILVTDGLANRPEMGLHSSKELSKFARTFPNYNHCTIHTLGIENGDLNSELLKTLAIDSGGIFKLTTHREGIPAFLGDVMASHLFTRCTRIRAKLEHATLLTSLPTEGALLRSDCPTYLVWEITSQENTLSLHIDAWDVQTKTSFTHSETITLVDVKTADIARILGCAVLAPILNGKYPKWFRDHGFAHADLLGLKSFGAPAAALVITLEEYIGRRNHELSQGYETLENSQDSLGAYMFGSSGGEVSSPQLIELRANAVQQSQVQDPRDAQRTGEN
jgi:hypothetical protein